MNRIQGQTGPVERAETPRMLSDRAGALLAVLIMIGFGIFRFSYFYFGALAEGEPGSELPNLIVNESSGTLALILTFFLVVAFVRRFCVTRENWRRRILLYIPGMILFSFIKTTLLWGSRAALYPLAGLGALDFGVVWLRYPQEVSNDVFVWILIVMILHLWFGQREAARRQVESARMQTALAEARLQGLQAQVHPHFLFNTLNTISAVMRRSPDLADEIITRLSDLLRVFLSQSERQTVSVSEEVQTLDLYMEIMKARYPDRLHWTVDVPEEVSGAEIPALVLQPLVENAIKHGISRHADAGQIRLQVRRDDDHLIATVEDDGPGMPRGGFAVSETGLGLSNCRQRLRYLYDDDADLDFEDLEPHGLRVILRVPWRVAVDPTRGGEA